MEARYQTAINDEVERRMQEVSEQLSLGTYKFGMLEAEVRTNEERLNANEKRLEDINNRNIDAEVRRRMQEWEDLRERRITSEGIRKRTEVQV